MKSEVLLRIIVVFPLTILAADDASEVGKGRAELKKSIDLCYLIRLEWKIANIF